MQARYYDPVVRRLASVDPARPSLGDAFNINRYGYARNNPAVNIDSGVRQAQANHESQGRESLKPQLALPTLIS